MQDDEQGGDEAQDVVLIDEDGRERHFRLHDAFDLEDVTYNLVEAADDPDQVLLLKDAPGAPGTQSRLETVDGADFERVIAMLEIDE